MSFFFKNFLKVFCLKIVGDFFQKNVDFRKIMGIWVIHFFSTFFIDT